ncbi:MAG: Rne/Rng family ribonuclease [Verrucomicrobiota bacterium]|jgi:ribonuclease G|nr:Rne/Rng family ribonuclease [Verrucomicrobiota bacterium]
MGLFDWLKRKTGPKREIVVNVEKLETRVAVVENGRVEEFQVEHPTEERLVGSIYKGRIQNLEHDLQAAFVDIGLKKNAFLHYWDMLPDDDSRLDDDDNDGERARPSRRRRVSNEDISKRFPPGSEIVVQVTKGPIGTKGPRVTANLSLPGRYLVMMPGTHLRGVSRKIGDAKERLRLKKILDRLPLPDDAGLIVRTVGSGANKRAFARDLRNLWESWNELQDNIKNLRPPSCVYQEPDLVERVVRDWLTEEIERVTIDDPEAYDRIRGIAGKISRRAKNVIHHYEGQLSIFEHHGVERQLEEAFRRKVNLKSGGYLVFDETEALIAIDVNTGRHRGKGSQEDAILEVNLEAVEEVARQLRLRNTGGLVVLDLIDMKSRKHQNAVHKTMKQALKRDRARTNVLPISELGLMEMTRQRQEESLLSQMYTDCPHCHGHGLVKSPLALSVDIQRQIAALMRKVLHEGRDMVELQIVVAPSVLDRLRTEDEAFLVELQRRYTGRLTFKSEMHRHPESFCIADGQTGKVLYSVGETKTV